MPAVGLCVFQRAAGNGQRRSTALQHGYRVIDTATAYTNEAHVGQCIRESGIACDEVFVTTKLKPGDYGYDSALRAFDFSVAGAGAGGA